MFDITSAVRTGTNTIEVKFTSAVEYAYAQAAAYPYTVPFSAYPTGLDNRNFIRKEQCSFAWDILLLFSIIMLVGYSLFKVSFT